MKKPPSNFGDFITWARNAELETLIKQAGIERKAFEGLMIKAEKIGPNATTRNRAFEAAGEPNKRLAILGADIKKFSPKTMTQFAMKAEYLRHAADWMRNDALEILARDSRMLAAA